MRIWRTRRHLAVSLFVAAAAGLPSASNRTQAPPPPIRVVLVGDSTVTDEAGWEAGFHRLVSGSVDVVNLAANGRSSRSFIDEGRWAEALAKRGQYYLIQFGHNDEPGKGPERETDPTTTYRSHMARYVDEARAIGATPVLITSLVRRLYNEDGTIRTTQTPYVDAVRALAIEKRVPPVARVLGVGGREPGRVYEPCSARSPPGKTAAALSQSSLYGHLL